MHWDIGSESFAFTLTYREKERLRLLALCRHVPMGVLLRRLIREAAPPADPPDWLDLRHLEPPERPDAREEVRRG